MINQIRIIGQNPELIHETVAQARQQAQSQLAELEAERRGLEKELGKWDAEVRRLLEQIAPADGNTPATARLADLQERIRGAERRATEVREQALALSRNVVDQREIAKAMSVFDPVWDSLTPREQARVVQLLVERVDYDGSRGKVAVTFHPGGIKTLAAELSDQEDAA